MQDGDSEEKRRIMYSRFLNTTQHIKNFWVCNEKLVKNTGVIPTAENFRSFSRYTGLFFRFLGV